jgi:hypothetical protein
VNGTNELATEGIGHRLPEKIGSRRPSRRDARSTRTAHHSDSSSLPIHIRGRLHGHPLVERELHQGPALRTRLHPGKPWRVTDSLCLLDQMRRDRIMELSETLPKR